MANFCLHCWNNLNYREDEKNKLKEKDVIFFHSYCEGCGEWKKCVKSLKKYRFIRIKNIILYYIKEIKNKFKKIIKNLFQKNK